MIVTVTMEGRTHAEVARVYEVSEATVSRWLARYHAEGDAAFEPRSRRPRRSPTATSDEVISLIVNLRLELTAGASMPVR